MKFAVVNRSASRAINGIFFKQMTMKGIAALLLSADRFKMVNHSCGHSIGDNVFIELAALRRCMIGRRKVLVRLKAGEFAIG